MTCPCACPPPSPRHPLFSARPPAAAYDDPYTVAGQGTAGLEILRQTDMEDDLDAIFV